jgi:hypothetical protein
LDSNENEIAVARARGRAGSEHACQPRDQHATATLSASSTHPALFSSSGSGKSAGRMEPPAALGGGSAGDDPQAAAEPPPPELADGGGEQGEREPEPAAALDGSGTGALTPRGGSMAPPIDPLLPAAGRVAVPRLPLEQVQPALPASALTLASDGTPEQRGAGAASPADNDPLVEFSVGGSHYTTSHSTLSAVPTSAFASMLGGDRAGDGGEEADDAIATFDRCGKTPVFAELRFKMRKVRFLRDYRPQTSIYGKLKAVLFRAQGRPVFPLGAHLPAMGRRGSGRTAGSATGRGRASAAGGGGRILRSARAGGVLPSTKNLAV